MSRFLALLLLLIATPAWAKQPVALPLGGACTVVAADTRPKDVSGPARTGPVVGYLLALSWSPEYCATGGDRSAASAHQCHRNRFGWVVHGLWPEAPPGRPYLQYCRPAPVLPSALVAKHLCRVPGANLMQHEWEKHGTCAFKTPAAYFDRIAALVTTVRPPDPLTLSTAGAVRAGFRDAQGRPIPPAAIAVIAGPGNSLQEVRLCYDRQFRYIRCVQKGIADHHKIQVRGL